MEVGEVRLLGNWIVSIGGRFFLIFEDYIFEEDREERFEVNVFVSIMGIFFKIRIKELEWGLKMFD